MPILVWRRQRRRQLLQGLAYLRWVSTPDPDDYWQWVDHKKIHCTIDLLAEMISNPTLDWAECRQLIEDRYPTDV